MTARLEGGERGSWRFEGNERFELRRLLGSGGMGEVFEALDRTVGATVAVKRLPHMGADALLRFKREFRVIADLSHPNLIQLGSLFSDRGQQWFFTMELVEGVDLLSWVRRPVVAPGADDRTLHDLQPAPAGAARRVTEGGFDEPRLRSTLGQLLEVLDWLHGLGRVHLDVKPSNVLVTPDGRVVLLDFGIAANLGAGERPTPAGTAAYAAPEQLVDGLITTAADLYALGTVLYEALTGRVPFGGTSADVMAAKHFGEIVPPRRLEPAVPDDLDRACVALLSREPSARPSARQVSVDLGRPRDGCRVAGLPFAGRAAELALLEGCLAEACAGRPKVAVLAGEGGVGKSALARHFVTRLALSGTDALLLAGVCHQQESVPYRAFDELMDRVAALAADAPAVLAGLAAGTLALLGRAFPVLAAQCPAAESSANQILDPQELRARLRQSMVALFRALAREAPLVILIEDLHWADDDSLELLEGLVGALEGARILVLLTQRPEARTVRLPDGTVRIELAGLPFAEAEALVSSLVHGAGDAERAAIASAVRDSGGNPLLLEALVRHALEHGQGLAGGLEEAISVQLARLPPPARDLLCLVANGSGTVSQRTVARALEIGEGLALGRLVGLLRQERLVRSRGSGPGDALDVYHDRIRAAVLGALPEAECRRDHARLAEALEREPPGEVDRETLARHWLGAAQPEKARGYVVEAAERSMTGLAFERAARLFALARELFLDDPAKVGILSRRLGDALYATGRCNDAADAYLQACGTASPADRLELERMAADAFVRGGHLERGAAVLDRCLAAVGEPVLTSRGPVLLRLLVERARLRLRLPEGTSGQERSRADATAALEVLWTASTDSGRDPLQVGFYQTRLARRALAYGPPDWQARAFALEAAYRSAFGGPSVQRVTALLEQATTLAGEDARAVGFVQLACAYVAFLRGDSSGTEMASHRTEAILRSRCQGTWWELALAQALRLMILSPTCRIREATQLTDRMLAEALERGDRFLELHARLDTMGFRWLAVDAPEEVRRQASQALALIPGRSRYRLEDFWALFCRTHADLYTGDAPQAFERVEEAWTQEKRSNFLRVRRVAVYLMWLRGRCALGVMRSGPRRRARDLVAHAVRWLTREPHTHARALGEFLRVGLLLQEGKVSLETLGEAVKALRATGQGLFAFPLERQRELLRGGAGIGALDAQLAADGFARPDRIAYMLLPVTER